MLNIESDVIRTAIVERDLTPGTLAKCLDLLCEYVNDDITNEDVTFEVWVERNDALMLACGAYDRYEYSMCLSHIAQYFTV
jgi:hypothetical protein